MYQIEFLFARHIWQVQISRLSRYFSVFHWRLYTFSLFFRDFFFFSKYFCKFLLLAKFLIFLCEIQTIFLNYFYNYFLCSNYNCGHEKSLYGDILLDEFYALKIRKTLIKICALYFKILHKLWVKLPEKCPYLWFFLKRTGIKLPLNLILS